MEPEMKSFRIQLIAMFIMVRWSLDVIPHFWERPPPEYVYKYHFGLEVESEDDSDWTICILRSQYPFNSTELEEFA